MKILKCVIVVDMIKWFCFITIIVFVSCKSEYTKYVESELDKGVINDSLIFGMRMGQTRKDFFRICWDLNKQQIITNGEGTNAQYVEKLDSTQDKTLQKTMLFYGIFDQTDTMRGMNIKYRYDSWAPWNKNRYSIVLLDQLKAFYTQNYKGNDFMEIDLDDIKYKAYAKIDGNRQILMYQKDDRDVIVKIEDLRHKYKK